MYPVIIGNGRSLQSDAVIAGYKIPKGVNIFSCYQFLITKKLNAILFVILEVQKKRKRSQVLSFEI